MSKKILVPLDGSKIAEHSLAYVRQLSQMEDADVLLLSVVDAEHMMVPQADEAAQREENMLRSYLEEIAEDFQKHFNIKVQTKVVKDGRPANLILTAVEAFDPELLVISTHGRSGFSRWRFGSVADKVIRGASCNTLVIGPHATERERWIEADVEPLFRSILVPLDGSELAEKALPEALRFATAFGTALHLVRAVPIPLTGGGLESSYTPDILGQAEDGARTYLARVAAGIERAVKTDVIVGTAAAVLEDYQEANQIDLIVMTSHGRGGPIRTALGSVADRMLGGKSPVLIVRALRE
jgi:nucleotide-binding universal stress UspA family protein